MIVGGAIVAGAPLFLLPLQILYLNMIGDVFPALALALGGESPGKMSDPPRLQEESKMTRQHWLAGGG
jgi:Ca2+-transporting ATPase